MGLFERNIRNSARRMHITPSERVWEAIEAGLLKRKKIQAALKIVLMLLLAAMPLYLLDKKLSQKTPLKIVINPSVQNVSKNNITLVDRKGKSTTPTIIPTLASEHPFVLNLLPTVVPSNSEISYIKSITAIQHLIKPGNLPSIEKNPVTVNSHVPIIGSFDDEIPSETTIESVNKINPHQSVGFELFAFGGNSFRNSNLEEIARGAGRSALINATKNGNGQLFLPTTCYSFGVKHHSEISNPFSLQYGISLSSLGWKYFAEDVSNQGPSASNSISTKLLQANNGVHSSIFENRLWFAGVPIQFRVKAIDKNKLSLNIYSGATAQIRITDDFAILSPGSGKYYNDESMLSKYNAEAVFGAMLLFKSKTKANIGLNVESGYQLVSAYKLSNPLKENLYGIQAGLVFQLKK